MKILAIVLHAFLELRAKVTLIILAGISTLVLLVLFLALSSEQSEAGMTLFLFGQAASPPVPPDAFAKLVTGIQGELAGGLFFGISLFGVFATASLIPDALEKGTIDIYLSKPMGRWQLLLGKHLGAVGVVFANIVYFVGASWLLIGLKLGVWNPHYLLAGLSMTLAFACLYSIVVFFAVVSRSTAVSIIGAFIYYFVAPVFLEGRESTLYMISENTIYRTLVDGLYYAFPQISALTNNIGNQIAQSAVDWVPFLQSSLSAAAIFGVATLLFNRTDY
jgi:ABC-type transport system involved in multi-copper enzyme maturation permease subunit